MLERKRQAAQPATSGDRKYAKQSELEEVRLKRLREEEEKERQEKARDHLSVLDLNTPTILIFIVLVSVPNARLGLCRKGGSGPNPL